MINNSLLSKKVNIFLGTVLVTMLIFLVAGCNFELMPAQKSKELVNENKFLQKGGVMHVGGEQEPDILNPFLSELNVTSELGNLIFDGLLSMNEKGEWIPCLALQVPTLENSGISADGKVLTYHLRQGVKWHDGVSFTADDVKFTWQFILQNKTKSVFASSYENIISVEVVNASTVVIKLKQYYPDWPILFNFVLPKHLLTDAKTAESFGRKPIGTGPFMFNAWDVVTGIDFVANGNYFAGRPLLDGINYRVVTDNDMLLGQLKSSQFDIVAHVAVDSIEKAQASSAVHLVFVPNYYWEHIDFNLDNPLFTDVKVRQAINLVIAKQEICENIMKKTVTEAFADQTLLSWAYNSSIVPVERNVNRAKELLKEAGWQPSADSFLQKAGKKFSFVLLVADGNPARQVVANIIARNLQEVGIETTIAILPKSDFLARLQSRKFEAALYASVNGFDPDVRYRWYSGAIPGSAQGQYGQNYAGWRNADIDKMLLDAVATMNVEKRKAVYWDIQKKIVEDYPVVPLFFYNNVSAVKNIVANYKPNPMQWGTMWNAREWGFYERQK